MLDFWLGEALPNDANGGITTADSNRVMPPLTSRAEVGASA
jgi:hypothetical protein